MNGPHSSRSPIRVAVEIPHSREHCWKLIHELSAHGFTVRDIAGVASGAAFTHADDFVEELFKAGILVVSGQRPTDRHGGYARVFTLVPGTGSALPVEFKERGTIQSHCWIAARNLSTFTAPELAAAASTDDLTVSVRQATDYIATMRRAGSITTPYRDRPKTYRLKPSANTGPAPLKVFKATIVFDPNTGRIVGGAEVLQ